MANSLPCAAISIRPWRDRIDRADLVSTLAAFRRKTRSSHLEVETYTWDVLPENLRTGSKAADIAREISFCVKELVG